MKKENKWLDTLVDCLLIGGATAIGAGVCLINIPAGLVVSGALLICGGIFLGRGLES